MKYFDLHLHPTTKAFLTDENLLLKKSPWDNLVVPGIDNFFGDIIDSQSSLSQIVSGNVRLAVCTFVPMEVGFAKSCLIRNLVPIISPLDRNFVKKIKDKKFTYWELFNSELYFFRKAIEGGNQVQILNKTTKIDESKFNLLLAIEGGHALMGAEGPIENLKKLKESDFHFLYLTLTHLTDIGENYLANHCYGQKLINQSEFYPIRYGISDLGRKVIDNCYDKEDHSTILIDIKHMSLRSRQMFYEYRNEKGYDFPILASHVGVTGLSYDQLKDQIQGYAFKNGERIGVHLKKVRGIGKGPRRIRTEFNPWTINLFNEEILEIIESGGMIGINLDQRILGFTSRVAEWLSKPSKEYFQEQEFIDLFGTDVPTIGGELEEDPDLQTEMGYVTKEEALINKKQHTRYLINNLLHIIKIGGERAWKQVCIGSDFDGMIDPINSCKSTIQFDLLEKRLVSTIRAMTKEAKEEDNTVDYYIYDLESQVRDFMYENGKNFITKFFK